MPQGMTSIPCCCRWAMDETPVHCFPSLKGIYEALGVSNVYIAYSDEKRMISVSPVCRLSVIVMVTFFCSNCCGRVQQIEVIAR